MSLSKSSFDFTIKNVFICIHNIDVFILFVHDDVSKYIYALIVKYVLYYSLNERYYFSDTEIQTLWDIDRFNIFIEKVNY